MYKHMYKKLAKRDREGDAVSVFLISLVA